MFVARACAWFRAEEGAQGRRECSGDIRRPHSEARQPLGAKHVCTLLDVFAQYGWCEVWLTCPSLGGQATLTKFLCRSCRMALMLRISPASMVCWNSVGGCMFELDELMTYNLRSHPAWKCPTKNTQRRYHARLPTSLHCTSPEKQCPNLDCDIKTKQKIPRPAASCLKQKASTN